MTEKLGITEKETLDWIIYINFCFHKVRNQGIQPIKYTLVESKGFLVVEYRSIGDQWLRWIDLLNGMLVACDWWQIVLEAEIDNSAALRLYENLGFIRDKRLHKYYLNGHDAFRLHLLLNWSPHRSLTCVLTLLQRDRTPKEYSVTLARNVLLINQKSYLPGQCLSSVTFNPWVQPSWGRGDQSFPTFVTHWQTDYWKIHWFYYEFSKCSHVFLSTEPNPS